MKNQLKQLPKNTVELTVTVEPVELTPYLERAAADLSRDLSIPGFRSGKAPYALVEQRVGAMRIYQHAAEAVVAATYPQAVREHQLTTVGPPQLSVEKIAPGNPFVYRAIVALLPQVTLADYRSLAVAKKTVTVEPKDIEETIANLRRMFGKETLVTRPAKSGDKVEIDMNAYMDNVPLDGATAQGQSVLIGEGHFIPGFEDNLIGLGQGQQKEFKLKFPRDYHRKDIAGKPVEFKVSVKNVYEIELPPVDDAFAKQVGQFEKLDDLQQEITKSITADKTKKEQERWELELIRRIIDKSTFEEIPDILIDAEKDKMIHELEHDVSHQGMKFDDYLQSIKKTADELKAELAPKAVERIKTALVLRAIAQAEKITVADTEVAAEVSTQRQQYAGKEDILKQINSDEYRDYLSNIMRTRKVFEFLDKSMGKK